MLKCLFLVAPAMLVMLAACSATNPAPPLIAQGSLASQTVVAQAGGMGDRIATLDIQGFNHERAILQAVHKWVAADIYQYEVTLKVDNNGTLEDLVNPMTNQKPLTVVVPQVVEPKTRAQFTNLQQGRVYVAEVIAKGNINATDASKQLNTTPAVARFDFTAEQDVNGEVTRPVQVVLDAVPFSGTGNVTFVAPADGVYDNTKSPETGEAK